MQRAIGGLFGSKIYCKEEVGSIPFDADNAIHTSHARGAIKWLVDQLRVDRVWVPSYLCPSMTKCIEDELVRYYPVDGNLDPESLSWTDSLTDRDLVCVIDYFGSRSLSAVRNLAENRKAWVLEDACQALLTEKVGENVDFVLYSLRKYVGVPDGGILVDNTGTLSENPAFDKAPAEWRIPQLNAWVRRGEFDRRGGAGSDRSWYQLYKEAKKDTPQVTCSMSSITKNMIGGAFDYPRISEKRRSNYKVLFNKIGDLSLLGNINDGEVPLGFVIRLEDNSTRELVKHKLIKNCIYPPVHWNLNSSLPPCFIESHRLSSEVLTLPCDQRYGKSDMEKIINVMKSAL